MKAIWNSLLFATPIEIVGYDCGALVTITGIVVNIMRGLDARHATITVTDANGNPINLIVRVQ